MTLLIAVFFLFKGFACCLRKTHSWFWHRRWAGPLILLLNSNVCRCQVCYCQIDNVYGDKKPARFLWSLQWRVAPSQLIYEHSWAFCVETEKHKSWLRNISLLKYYSETAFNSRPTCTWKECILLLLSCTSWLLPAEDPCASPMHSSYLLHLSLTGGITRGCDPVDCFAGSSQMSWTSLLCLHFCPMYSWITAWNTLYWPDLAGDYCEGCAELGEALQSPLCKGSSASSFQYEKPQAWMKCGMFTEINLFLSSLYQI